MAKKWFIRDYQSGDETAIVELFNTVFVDKRPLTNERWKWQYLDNQTGVIAITLAEGENGDLAGQYAVRPVRMMIGGKTRLGTLSLDTMTHPNYQRQGIFIKLANYLYNELARRGIPITYGFPNEFSYKGLVEKLQWSDLCTSLPLYVKPLNLHNVVKSRVSNKALASVMGFFGQLGYDLIGGRRRQSLPADYRLARINNFDERIDILCNKAATLASIMVVRDSSYLNWRYVKNPTDTYTILIAERADEIHGYIVLKLENRYGLRVGFIIDLLTMPDMPGVCSGLVGYALEYFLKEDVDIVGCLMFQHASYAKALRKNVFFLAPKRLIPQEMHLGVRDNNNEFSKDFLTDPTNWYITFGDHDNI